MLSMESSFVCSRRLYRRGGLETEVPADLNISRPVGVSGRRPEGIVLHSGIHAGPGDVIESIQEFTLESEIHLVMYGDDLRDCQVGVDPLGIVQPHQRAKLAGCELRTDVLRIGLSL